MDRMRPVEENQVLTLTVLDRTLRFQRPVSFNRTRPVVVGTLLETTGRWGFSIRSVEAAASGQYDRSVRSERVLPSEGI